MSSTVWTYDATDTLWNCRVSGGNVLLDWAEFSPSGVVLYHANEGAGKALADSSGNGNTGNMSAANWHPNPWLGASAVGPSVTVTPASVPGIGLNSWTIETWVFVLANRGDGNAYNFSQYAGPSGQQASMSTRHLAGSNFRLQCYVRDNANHAVSISATFPGAVGAWTHVALMKDGNILRWYINGVQMDYRDISGYSWSNWTSRNWWTDQYVTGLDEMRDSAAAVYPGGATFYPKRYHDSGYWQVAATRAQENCLPGLLTVTLAEALPSGCALKARLLSLSGRDTGWRTLAGEGTVYSYDFSGEPADAWYPAVQESAGGALNAYTPTVSQIQLEWTPAPAGSSYYYRRYILRT